MIYNGQVLKPIDGTTLISEVEPVENSEGEYLKVNI